MEKTHCVITVTDLGQNYDREFSRLADLGVAVDWKKDAVMNSKDESVVAAACRGYDFVIASNERWGAGALAACRDRLRLLVRYGIGFDSVDLEAATRNGIPVTNLPGCNAESVAELAVGLILAAARDIARQNAFVKAGAFQVQTMMAKSICGKTVSLLGLGHIGKAVVRMLAGFRCRFLAYDVARDEAFARQYGVAYVGLEEALAQGDVVSVHLPFLPETKWTINRKTIALMKPSAIVINTSRGPLVNSDDLAEALRAGRIYAAGLDVFENEVGSDKPIGYQFLSLDKATLTPHSASMTLETFETMMRFAVDAIECFLKGEPLPGPLNGVYMPKGGR